MSWGPEADPYLTIGSDLNVFGQGLVENIVLRQTQGANVNTGGRLTPETSLFNQVQRIPDSDQVNPGLLFQSAIPVTQRLKVRSGGRVDWVHTSSGARTIDGNLNLFGAPVVPGQPPQRTLDPLQYSTDPNNPNLSRDFALVGGFLRGEYQLDDDWTVLAGVGHAQRPPTLTELYASGPFIGVLQQGTSRLIGDPRLSPEKLTQLDIGLTGDYEFFQVGVTGFYAWVDDYITFDANRSGLGLTQVVFTNTDRATLAGAELFTQMDLTAWLTTFGTLSYVQGIDQTATDRRRAVSLDSSRRDDPLTLRRKSRTEPLPQIPPLESRLGVRFHAPSKTPRWQIEFSARVVSDQNNVATSLGEFRSPGFTVFNVRGFWQATDNLLVTAGVENFGDLKYREHLDPISGNLLNAGPLLRPGTNFFFNTQFTY
jgi:iron complex outermembrane receptor protein